MMHASRLTPSSQWGLLLAVALLVPVCGLAASFGSPLIALFLAFALLSAVLITSPLALLWVVVIGGLVLAGVTELYMPALRHARWGVVIAALALGPIALSSIVWSSNQKHLANRGLYPAFLIWAALFFAIAVFSGLLNLGFKGDTVVGFKGYFQVWTVLIAFALLPLRPKSVDRFIGFLVWLALLQVPFVLHQYFVLVPQRSGALDAAYGIVAQDILVGTFTASMSGGGAGPAMAVLMMIALVITLARAQAGHLSSFRAAAAVFVFLGPLVIGENKIALVLLPIGMLIVFEEKLRGNPLRAAGLLIVTASLVVALFVLIASFARGDAYRSSTLGEQIDEMWSYNVGDRGYGLAVLNRTTVYPFWAKYHRTGGSAVNTLVGHGPGASKDTRGTLAERSVASHRFARFAIGLTGISGLLWDVGILGTALAIGFFVSAYRTARRLVREVEERSTRWVNLKAVQAGVAMLGVSLLHNSMFLYEIGFQTLLMLLVGYLVYVHRTLKDVNSEPRDV